MTSELVYTLALCVADAFWSQQFREAIEASIDTETSLNLSYQDLGHRK